MELTVWKTINSKDVAAVLSQPTLEFQQGSAVVQFRSRLATETEAYSVRLIGADPIADLQRIVLKRIEGFGPSLAAMNIGAVGEVKAVVELHRDGSKYRPIL